MSYLEIARQALEKIDEAVPGCPLPSPLTPKLDERESDCESKLPTAPRTSNASNLTLADELEPTCWEDSVDPLDPCPTCGGTLFWWDLLGDQRCGCCDPPTAALRFIEKAETIRRRHGIPSPPGIVEWIAEVKRFIDTCKSANYLVDSEHG